MEKYFVIKDVDGMCFIQKSFNEKEYIKYYVAKVIVTK